MKLQAFSRIAKKAHTCIVFTRPEEQRGTAQDEMIISNGTGIYRCGCIPVMSGEAQICALLDINKKQRDKMEIREETYYDLKEVAAGFDLHNGEAYDEADTESIKISITYDGKEYEALKCADGEMIFYNRELLAPLVNEIQSPYFKIRSRIADTGRKRFRYLIAKDGFTTLAAFMPIIALTNEFMADLHGFVQDCVLQKQLEDNRVAACSEGRAE